MEISVMQWNVWMHEKKEHLLELITAYNPDIVCMQELTIDSPFQSRANITEYLSNALGYEQFHKVIPNRTPEGIGQVATGIITRMPIIGVDWRWTQEPLPGGSEYRQQYRLYTEVSVNTGKGNLTVGTTHVSYTDRFEDIADRKSEADAVVGIAREHRDRYILTGDFNSVPGSYIVRQLDTFMLHAGPEWDAKTWTTKPHSYNGFEETELNWRLDYIFTTPDIRVDSAQIIKTDYSDHLPILIRAYV